jgi:hypothetical protein
MAYTVIRWGNDYNAATGQVDGNVISAITSTDFGSYPNVLGGITMGRLIPTALGIGVASGWLSGDTLALRGRWRRGNDTSPAIFRVDVPNGAYRVIMGTASATYQRNRWRLLNGVDGPELVDEQSSSVPAFWPNDNEPGSFDQWIDQEGVVREIAPNPLVGVFRTVEVTNGCFIIVNGGHSTSTFSSDLSFFAFEATTITPPPTPVANALRILPSGIPSGGFVTGVEYTIDVEAIDTALNVRATTYADAVTLGIDGGLLSGYTISAGTTTRSMTSGFVSFPGIVFSEVPDVALAGLAATGLMTPLNGEGSAAEAPAPVAGFARYYLTLLEHLELI